MRFLTGHNWSASDVGRLAWDVCVPVCVSGVEAVSLCSPPGSRRSGWDRGLGRQLWQLIPTPLRVHWCGSVQTGLGIPQPTQFWRRKMLAVWNGWASVSV